METEMRNKIVSLILCIVFILSLFSACAGPSEDDGRVKVIATNFAMYDFARAVCGDDADVTMLLTPGSESHDFEATLEDVAKIAEADVFVYVGGESDAWVDGVFESIGSASDDIVKISAMDVVGCIESDYDHDHDHDHEETDEHVWTSIPNAISIIEAIADAVAELLPESASEIGERCRAYVNELLEIDREMMELVESSERRTIVVTDRFPFVHMAEHLGVDYVAAFDGCTSDTEPSLSVINTLVREIRENGIDTVFVIEFSDRKTASAIAEETGADILELSSAHNVTKAEFESGITYADIMRKNMEALKSALD